MSTFILGFLSLIVLPIIVTALWELWLRGAILPVVHRVRYKLRKMHRKEPPLNKMIERLCKYCGPDENTKRVMKAFDIEALAIDGCFELLHSHAYKGWTEADIEFQPMTAAINLPKDLQELVSKNQPAPPSHGKYRLFKMIPDSSERPRLQIQLSPTSYFLTFPIQRMLFEPCLQTDGPAMISPFDKYRESLYDFSTSSLPNIVCAHVVVVLPENKLLLTQRMKMKEDLDWQLGKWSCSFEEQMTVKTEGPEPRIDKDFFDTVCAGLIEEVGVTKSEIEDVRILSLTLEGNGIVINPIAFVLTRQKFEEVEKYWLLKARDGARRELRKVDWIDFTQKATNDILTGKDLRTTKNLIGMGEWHVTARMRLLTALFHVYGIEKTLGALPREEKGTGPEKRNPGVMGDSHLFK